MHENSTFQAARTRHLILLLLFIISVGGCGTMNRAYTFPDPVTSQIADPFVLTASDGNYYMYGTNTRSGGALGFPVLASQNLQDWESLGMAYAYNPDGWAVKDFWAPEVLEYHGHYYMFYTARDRTTEMLKIGLAIADSPTGPFRDASDTPLLDVDYAVIDPSPFLDDDGRIYLYYVKDVSENVVDC